jgi:hypothetical protein
MKSEEFYQELKRVLLDEPERYAPLEVDEVMLTRGDTVNGRIDLRWAGRKATFIVHGSPRSAPSIARPVMETLEDLDAAGTRPLYPLLAVPYLSKTLYQELEERRISGIDLNGNYCVLTDDLLALRLDRENRYPESRDISGIYSRNSSIVGRLFLVENRSFERVGEIHEEIKSRGGDISLSTVSKVLSGLADDLMIEKQRGNIRVLQPEALLDRLRDGYVEPRLMRTVRLKLPALSIEAVSRCFGPSWVWSGSASATEYAITTRQQQPVVYTKSIDDDRATEFRDERFFNCVARQTRDSFVFFDARDQHVASPIEAYLVLSRGGKRDREVAEEIRERLLQPFA